MDEITYTPGRLAKKLGISKATLMRHLRKTGLIDQCVLTQHGHWRIPYSLAVKISSPEALTVSPRKVSEAPHHKSRGQSLQVSPSSVDTSQPKAVGVGLPDYRQIGKTLRKAGFTMTDLIRYIQQQMEVTHEQSPYNSAQRNENQTDEAKSNGSEFTDARSGLSANSDISNSSEK